MPADRAALEAFLDAPDEPAPPPAMSRRAALEAFLDEPDVSLAESAGRGVLQGGLFSFSDEIKGGIGAGYYAAAKGIRSLLPGGVPEDAPSIGDVYRAIRDQEQQSNAAAQQANPITYGTGEVGGVLATSGVNPVSVLRAGGRGLVALGTREAYTAAAGRALLTQGVKGAAGGAGYGALSAAGSSEADLTRGEVGEFLEDVAGGAKTGAKFGAPAGAFLGATSAATAARAERLAGEAATAQRVGEFDAAVAALPEERAAVAAENQAAREAANAENAAAREQYRTETAAAKREAQAESKRRGGLFNEERIAAKAEAEAATAARREAAEAEAAEATRKNSLLRTGLEGKQKTLGGAKRAKARAQALVQEPLPDSPALGLKGDPSKRLIEEAEKLAPEERLDLATGLRREAGAVLGAVRDELAKVDVLVPVGPLRSELRGAFGDLPSAVQGKALEQLDAMIGSLAKGGALSPAALRKLIEDSEAFANFGTPNLEAALGDARGRVFQAARAALVRNERELIQKALPDRAPEYIEANRRYGVYSDFELGSKVMLERANKGLPAVKAIKPAKVERVAPRSVPRPEPATAREVPRPTLREPLLKPAPEAPQFEGGDEALAAGRKLLEPSLAARAGAAGIRLGGRATGALLGSPGGYIGGRAGEALGGAVADPIAALWLRWLTPTAGKLSAKAAKLERIGPMLERALQQGPQAVARLHAQLLDRSPDYRNALEEEENGF